jgi:DNA-directed RNA polymerase specialized sigma24 family protein
LSYNEVKCTVSKENIKSQEGCSEALPPQEVIFRSISGPDERSERYLSEALSKLPEKQRDIILLKIFEGFSFRDIASLYDVSINTASSR